MYGHGQRDTDSTIVYCYGQSHSVISRYVYGHGQRDADSNIAYCRGRNNTDSPVVSQYLPYTGLALLHTAVNYDGAGLFVQVREKGVPFTAR